MNLKERFLEDLKECVAAVLNMMLYTTVCFITVFVFCAAGMACLWILGRMFGIHWLAGFGGH